MGEFRSQIIYVRSEGFDSLDEGTVVDVESSTLIGRTGGPILQLVVDEMHYPKVTLEISAKLGISRMAYMYVSDTQSDLRWRCAEMEAELDYLVMKGSGTEADQYILTYFTRAKLMVLDTVPSSK